MEEGSLTFFPMDSSDLDNSFTSSTSTSSYATTLASSSARSSLSLPSFSLAPSIKPLPHSRSDPHWSAVSAASNLSPDGTLHLSNLKLLRHLGSGNLARVFHCRLRGYDGEVSGTADFALKVVDLDALARTTGPDDNKLSHVRTEARVLSALDHPFLPTLYARLDASHYACFLIDYCPGGDLHSLLRRRPGHRLSSSAVRFYAGEVLLALEYLHAHGFVYRDLKPENVLIQADGHVMLSDFDLCFQADVTPALRLLRRRRKGRSPSCFGGGSPTEEEDEVEFVAEPHAAYSRECVGTHEYLSPEVVGGKGHGNAVDWWAFGVFVYELLYGRTPFKGSSKEATLRNIAAGRELRFPADRPADDAEAAARDLIARLLVRDPKQRLGSTAGAAEIKKHPFFEGVRWPLIRCSPPPVAVGPACGTRRVERRRGKWTWSGWNSGEDNGSIIRKMRMRLGLGSKKRTKDRVKIRKSGVGLSKLAR